MAEEPAIDQIISEFLKLKGRTIKTFNNWKECTYSVRGEPLIVTQTIQHGQFICNFVSWKHIVHCPWGDRYLSYQQYSGSSEDGINFKVRTNNPGPWLDMLKDKLNYAKRFAHIKENKGEQLMLPF